MRVSAAIIFCESGRDRRDAGRKSALCRLSEFHEWTMNKKALPSVEPPFTCPAWRGQRGLLPVLPPSATPSGGGGSCSCAMPRRRSLAPSVGSCSLHSLRPLVGRRCRLSGRLSGLVCRSTRCRADRVSGLVAGLVGSRRGCRVSGLVAGLVGSRRGCRVSGLAAGLVSAPWGELLLNVRLV